MLDRLAGGAELGLADQPVVEKRPLERDEPALAVPIALAYCAVSRLPRADLGDEAGTERLEVDDPGVGATARPNARLSHGSEKTSSPFDLEAQQAPRVSNDRVGGHAAGVSARPAPIMLSR